MHNQQLRFLPFQHIFILLSLLALAGCSDFFQAFKAKPKPVISQSTQAEKYVETLALTQLALLTQPDNLTMAKPYVKTLNAYVFEKKSNRKNLQLVVLELDYTAEDQKERQMLIVPVPLVATSPKFSALQRVSKKFSGIPHTLHNMRAYYVTVMFPPSTKFSKENRIMLHQQLLSEQQNMMADAEEVPPLENARLQLQLVRFFMRNHARDSAYLALENVKDALGFLAERSPDADITALSQETDALESRLHKEMPYKL